MLQVLPVAGDAEALELVKLVISEGLYKLLLYPGTRLERSGGFSRKSHFAEWPKKDSEGS